MTDTVKVRVYIVGTYEISRTIEIPASEYAEFSERYEHGRDRELAQDLMDTAKLTFRDGDIDDLRVEEFEEMKKGASA